jgi:hypothetical protein
MRVRGNRFVWHPHLALAAAILFVSFRCATQGRATQGPSPPSERDRDPPTSREDVLLVQDHRGIPPRDATHDFDSHARAGYEDVVVCRRFRVFPLHDGDLFVVDEFGYWLEERRLPY